VDVGSVYLLPTCNHCKGKLIWKKPYVDGAKFADNTTELSGKPHICPKYNAKEGEENYFYNPKNYYPYTNKLKELAFKAKFEKALVYCDICKGEYRLAYPCDHHLPEGYKFKNRKYEYMKKLKENRVIITEDRQTFISN